MLRHSVNQVCMMRWPFERSARLVAELGAPALTVWGEKLSGYGMERGRRLLAELGLRVAAWQAVGGFALAEPSRWPAQIAEARRGLALAEELGAGRSILISGPADGLPYEEAEQRFLRILEELLPDAAARGVVLVLEHNHSLRVDLGFVHTLHDVLDLVDRVDSPWLRACCEINNAWMERWLLRDIRERVDAIGLVQLSDFKRGTTSTPARVPPGDGIIPLRRIVGALERAGYSGDYDIEMLGPDIEALGYEAALRRALAWVRGFEASA